MTFFGLQSPDLPEPAPAGPAEAGDEVADFLRRLNVDPEIFQRLQSENRQTALLNLGVMAGVYFKLEVAESAPSARISDVRLALNASTYAKHGSFNRFWELVEPHGGIAVVSAPPNHGRATLAYRLLARLRYKDLIEEAHWLTFGGSDTLPGRRIPREPGRAYLLELPPDEQGTDDEIDFKVKDDFCDQLASLQELLSRRRSRLIVLTRPEQWARISRGAPYDFAPEIGDPPKPIEITRTTLRSTCRDLDDKRWLDEVRITKLFKNAKPIDAVDIADLILGEHRAGDSDPLGGRDFDQQVENVVNARANWRKKLLEWHKNPRRTAIERNFLLAAAILRDAPVSHIYAKAADLCKAFSDATLELAGQSAPGIIELLDSVEAEPTQSEGIRFQRPHWEDAAVEYFWLDRPLSRQVFVKWLAETPLASAHGDLVKISQAESRLIGLRVVEFAVRFAVRHERHLPLAALADAWHGQKLLWNLLVDAIDSAATAEASSPYVRKMLLEWAKANEPSRKKLVAAVCARNFGAVYTGFALRRLRHIGDACTSDVLDDLQGAVQRLWNDDAARVTLLQYLGLWCRTDYAAGRVTFLTLALIKDESSGLPQILTVFEHDSFSGVSINVLEIAWQQLLDYADLTQIDSGVQKCISFWMTAALDTGARDRIFVVLKAAASGATGTKASNRRDVLRGCVQQWATSDPADTERRRSLQHELSVLLDVEIARAARSIASRRDRR